jgi:hypothetical protein
VIRKKIFLKKFKAFILFIVRIHRLIKKGISCKEFNEATMEKNNEYGYLQLKYKDN